MNTISTIIPTWSKFVNWHILEKGIKEKGGEREEGNERKVKEGWEDGCSHGWDEGERGEREQGRERNIIFYHFTIII